MTKLSQAKKFKKLGALDSKMLNLKSTHYFSLPSTKGKNGVEQQ